MSKSDRVLTLEEAEEVFKDYKDTEFYEDLPQILKILEEDYLVLKKLKDKKMEEADDECLKRNVSITILNIAPKPARMNGPHVISVEKR